MVASKTLVKYLKENSIDAGSIDRLKMIYRPLICPFDRLISYVHPDNVVVDIGCGSGQFCLLLGAFSPARSIYGYEISQKLIDHARKLCENKTDVEFHFDVFNGSDIPDKIKEADVVFLVDVLHHIPPPARLRYLESIYQKMNSGGRLILKDMNAGSPFVVFNKLHDLIFSRELVNEISLSEAIKILQRINFEIIHTEKKLMYVYPHYTIIAKKP